MQCLDPQTVELKEALRWFKQSFELICRRYIAFFSSVALFFAVLYCASQLVSQLSALDSPIIMVSVLVVFSAFAFFVILANFILLSHWANHSENFNLQIFIRSFMPNQKVFFQMALLAVVSGLFFWYVTIILHPEKNLLTSTTNIIQMLGSTDSLLQFIVSENAVFLYFALLVFLLFRTYFSVPLILFHQLSYQEAQSLSQKGIIKNIKVITQIMAIWIIAFLMAIQAAPIMAVLLLPLFGTFLYISFRHIFWGQGSNEAAKEVIKHNMVATSKVS